MKLACPGRFHLQIYIYFYQKKNVFVRISYLDILQV